MCKWILEILRNVKIVFSILNLLMNDNHYLCDTPFFRITCLCIMFVGNIVTVNQ
jgi:hypothetical protein